MLTKAARPSARRMRGTDSNELGREIPTASHDQSEYRKGDVHTQTIESVCSMLKRQIVGTDHWVCEKHLDDTFPKWRGG